MHGLVAVLTLSMAGEAARPKTQSRDVLPVAPSAVELVRGGERGATWLQYDVRNSYPARETIAYLVDAMSQRGWNLVRVADFRPVASFEVPRWMRLPERKRGREAGGYVGGFVSSAATGKGHLWEGWWRDRSGRGVAITIEYSCPMELQGLHSVWARVSARMYRPEEAAQEEAARTPK